LYPNYEVSEGISYKVTKVSIPGAIIVTNVTKVKNNRIGFISGIIDFITRMSSDSKKL